MIGAVNIFFNVIGILGNCVYIYKLFLIKLSRPCVVNSPVVLKAEYLVFATTFPSLVFVTVKGDKQNSSKLAFCVRHALYK